MMQALTARVDDFEDHRATLFGIAYRLLGSVADAEDLVQDAHLRYRSTAEVRDTRAYLVTVITRLCIDHLRSARVRREEYVGPWLPEPVLLADDLQSGPDAAVSLRESVSVAFLILLESLDPVERAVFVLHDVFECSHADVGRIVGRSEAASRQLLKRARAHVAERRRRRAPSPDDQRRITLRFLAAAATGDIAGMIELLTEDVVAYADGGGRVTSALNPIVGADRVARFAAMFPRKEPTARIELCQLNGECAVLIWLGQRLSNVFAFELAGERIASFYVQRNPDKLRVLAATLAVTRTSTRSKPTRAVIDTCDASSPATASRR